MLDFDVRLDVNSNTITVITKTDYYCAVEAPQHLIDKILQCDKSEDAINMILNNK